MAEEFISRRDLDFLLYEFLDTQSVLQRSKYRHLSREELGAILDTTAALAEKYFANHYAKGDANEPLFVDGRVQLIPEIHDAWKAITEFGFLGASFDHEEGGLQLPDVISSTVNAQLSAANISTSSYHFVTIAAANMIRSFGTEEQRAQLLPPMMDGRFSGTMALTEPAQGSALADLTTSAEPGDDGSYRIRGQKIWITAGDHELTRNIIHLVLARMKGAPAGTAGLSLFIVPKYEIMPDGSRGARNDVQLSGLLHKMGCRNATSTILSFGEREGAIGYLLGKPNQGLRCMFQMMNESRIGVGVGAAALSYRAYLYSLNYARERKQGRLPSSRDPLSPQLPIIAHADVRRMLLAQKTYVEGSLALCLYSASLLENSRTAGTEKERQRAAGLLDLLTPVVKSWPSKYGCMANDLAIQVLGGYGYSREYPLEQLYRDQRLNPIHEGTEAIHGMDLLSRRIPAKNMLQYQHFCEEMDDVIASAGQFDSLVGLAGALGEMQSRLTQIAQILQERLKEDPDRTLANATLFLNCFGQVVLGWIWLRQAVAALRGLNKSEGRFDSAAFSFYQGKIQAARYYFEHEMMDFEHKCNVLERDNMVFYAMQDEWF